jgi:hypothetical protein
VDATYLAGGYQSPEIRVSATGAVVAPVPIGNVPALRGYDPPYGLAATGPDSFVLGMMTPSDCATQFFRFRLNPQGRPGALTRVGPTLPGTLGSIVASAGGEFIGYEIDGGGCPNAHGQGSYLGVLDVSTGRTRQWTDASSHLGSLSMSANGRLLAYSLPTGKAESDGGLLLTGAEVETLATDAPPGTVATRSRVVARMSLQTSGLSTPAVLLSPTGASFYLCSEPFVFYRHIPKRITDTAQIVAYRTATGKPTGVLANFAASYATTSSGESPVSVGCGSMALDSSGRYLLVPYLQTLLDPAQQTSSAGSLTTARIDIATRATSDWTLRYGANGDPGTMSVAW